MNSFQPLDAVDLAVALAGSADWPREAARHALARAERIGVDPMAVLAAGAGDGPEAVWRNAAGVLGVEFCEDVRAFLSPLAPDAQIDRLAGMRTARGRRWGRETLFVAPGFAQVAALSAHIARDPQLRERLCVVSPATLEAGLAEVNAERLAANAVQRLAQAFPLASAHLDLRFMNRAGFVLFLFALVAVSMSPMLTIQPVVLALVSLVLAAPSVFRLWAAFTHRRNRPLRPERLRGDADLPVYTVLIPLRNEAHMVPQIARAMRRLDYPSEKLDIKFVVESASPRTVLAARRELGDQRFSLVVVPRKPPHTKPKAINYALPLARGSHVVVFDAEDVPEPGQLRMAASLFAEDDALECLQAELVIANAGRNWLTRLFAAEYAGHFGVLLPAIARAKFPMPLGGTSNHFRTATLRRIGAWDAFNVTEDADLGIRMARLGLKVANFAAATWEEAPETVGNWLNQRSRWMKGWMQTLLVHARRPGRLWRDLGASGFAAFQVFVTGMVLSFAMHGLFLVSILVRLVDDLLAAGVPDPWTLAGLVTLMLGYCGAAAVSVIGLERIGRGNLIPALIGLPLYWLLAWWAVLRAAWDLVARPYHWAKTAHRGYPVSGPPMENAVAGQPAPHPYAAKEPRHIGY